MDRQEIIKNLRAQINVNGHIIGVASGSGLPAKYAAMGGADFILALSAGKFRQMGRSSLASFLCYANSNQMVLEFACKEMLPQLKTTPILFGINANDPTIHLYEYIKNVKSLGFSGLNNFPSVGLFDGQFREALEEEGINFEREVEAIKIARFLSMFTVAFVFNERQAIQMAEAGADVLCVHLGFTSGGILGAKRAITLEHARITCDRIFKKVDEQVKRGTEIIKVVYGGPISLPADMLYLYENTACVGCIGGSSFDRIPTETAILNTTIDFKTNGRLNDDNTTMHLLNKANRKDDYIAYIKQFIHEHYASDIKLSDLSLVTHVSSNYLSTKFKQEVGCSFTQYLVKYRINKAAELLEKENIRCNEIAGMVGYRDYAQFSKMFKKYKGLSPNLYRESNINTSI
jgi:predicted TIM-barrel enzyme/AraC-like DNA-binding protein